MSAIQGLYQQAQLAEAAYADFAAYPNDPIKALRAEGFSQSQATAFTNEWSVVDQQTVPGSGFSATVFQNKAGQYSLAIRGSQDAYDFIADTKLISTDGVAVSQMVDMYNYWQSLTHLGVYQVAKLATQTIETYFFSVLYAGNYFGIPTALLNLFTGVDIPTTYDAARAFFVSYGYIVEGGTVYKVEPDLSTNIYTDSRQWGDATLAGQSVSVDGHSLGGHLAMAFSRLFPDATNDVTAINGLGFKIGDGNVNNLFAALASLSGSGTAPEFNAGKIENVYGMAGPEFASMNNGVLQQPGGWDGIFTESATPSAGNLTGNSLGHGTGQMTDSLAVYNLIAQLDPSLTVDAITGILKAESNVAANSLESTITDLGKLFNVPSAVVVGNAFDGAGRNKLYTALNDIQHTVQSCYGIVALDKLDAATLLTDASASGADGMAYRYALSALNPFAVTGADYSGFNTHGELDLYNPATGTGDMTSAYLTDRTAMLSLLMQRNTTDSATISGDILYRDVEQHITLHPGSLFADDSALQQIVFGGIGNNTLSGGDNHDRLYGMGGNDTLTGRGGNDTLFGGSGNDTLDGGTGTDTYVFNTGDGQDTIKDSDGLGKILENNIQLTAQTAIYQGNNLWIDGDTTYQFTPGNLFAVLGIGTMTITTGPSTGSGQAGDTITIDNFDLNQAQSDASNGYLGLHFKEHVAVTAGVHDPFGTGNYTIADQTATVLQGALQTFTVAVSAVSDQVQTLRLQLASDIGVGLWEIINGADTYVIGSADTVVEYANEGNDTVQTDSTYILGITLENLTLTGMSAINGTGNSLANILVGNAGDNVLDGGSGADSMQGGLGNDTYIVDNSADVITENANEGTDAVQSSATYTLSANIESLTLTGTAAINGTGNAQNNTLIGNSSANVLSGGGGDDFYILGVGDTVQENANEGVDSVQTDLTYTLGANVENLTLTGTGRINGTGNALNNIIIGNTANNVLSGGAGDDRLDGGGGTDKLVGGVGNDYYVIDSSRDAVIENANEGIDTVQASFTYTLGTNLENLVLAPNVLINGTGNAANNIITGNALDNVLDGAAGADTLIGGGGNDTYIVDNNADAITENANEGIDTVQSSVTYILSENIESLTLTGTAAINGTGNSLNNTLTGNSAANVLTGGGGDDTYIIGAGDTVVENANEGIDTVQSSATFTLGANVENLTLIGTANINGTGNSLDNVLTGNARGNNVLSGGLGDDIYIVSSGDTVTENANEGIDTVQSDATFMLGANIENLTLTGISAINGTGNTLNNVLTGNSAANVLSGGAGDDTYVVGTGDTVVENLNQGVDNIQSAVSFTLGANIENLTLTGAAVINGTGNSLNNILVGNNANNILDGGAGADTMSGGLGDDTYVVDNAADVVIENAGEGNDTVQSTISYILGSNVENVTLLGTAAINATGDTGNNVLTGNSAANVLTGGGGDDVYIVGAGDTVVESVNSGTDTVQSSATFTLDANIENLTLTGTAVINGTGNSLNNVITGNAANNILDGGAGYDTLYGGDGNDTLYGTVGDVLKGGLGNDLYILTGFSEVRLDSGNGSSYELGGGGVDTIQADVSINLWNNYYYSGGRIYFTGDVENATLTGSSNASIDGTESNNVLIGNSGDNYIWGFGGNDQIDAGAGNDFIYAGSGSSTLAGGAGNDSFFGYEYSFSGGGTNTMMGGTGDDYYSIRQSDSVVITENLNEGTDTVSYTGANYTLSANIENLIIYGSAGTGNALNNVLTGMGGDNSLTGGAGNDTLIGSDGADTLIGGTGVDIIDLTETTQAIDRVVVNAGDSLVTGIDKVSKFNAAATLNDQLDFVSTTIAANGPINGTDVGGILSHSVTNGMIGFDDLNQIYTTPMIVNAGNVAAVDNYLATNIVSGNNVAFYVDANSNGVYTDATDYLRVFQGGAAAAGALSTDDIFVDIYTTMGLGGVTALGHVAAANTVQIV